MKLQQRVFDEVKRKIESTANWACQLASLLCLTRDAVYRRERGEVLLNIDELELIITTYGIDAEDLFNLGSNNLRFRFVNINISHIERYKSYLEDIKSLLKQMYSAEKKEIIFCADDIPIFHFMGFPELTYFKLYVWSQSLKNINNALPFEDFVYEMKKYNLEALFYEIVELYKKVPSREIWTKSTIDSTLILLEYYDQIGSFSDPLTKRRLVEQLRSLIAGLQEWTLKESKNGNVFFDLYLTPIDLGLSQMLCVFDGKYFASLKLYTINSITTTDSRYIEDNINWMKAIMNKSSCLSRTSEKERVQFFKSMQDEVSLLQKKFSNSV
ncbi:hypothetical protein [Sphingobacterium hungaricum]|nr:hypothetical protein [Sphingobacterium hungaricum]